MDRRPPNCRERLRENGKAYPRSGCENCGSVLVSNWSCPYESANEMTEYEITFIKTGIMPEEELRKLKDERRILQEESDELLEKILMYRRTIKQINFDVNRLKRIVRENSKENEGRRS